MRWHERPFLSNGEHFTRNIRICLHGETIVIGGDLNADLNSTEHASVFCNSFFNDYNLCRCDSLNSNRIESNYTWFNDALGHYSVIDYFITSDLSELTCYNVVEPSVNLSDHRPVIAHFSIKKPIANHTEQEYTARKSQPLLSCARITLICYHTVTQLVCLCRNCWSILIVKFTAIVPSLIW